MAAGPSAWAKVSEHLADKAAGKSQQVSWQTAISAAGDAVDRRATIALLFRMAKDGHATALRQWLEREELPPLALDLIDEQGFSALHYATHRGHADCAKVLLASGANCEVRDRSDGNTPLVLAARLESLPMMRMLIEHHASIEASDKDGITALAWAARQNQAEALELLLEARQTQQEEAMVARIDEDKEPLISALRTCLRNGSAECVCQILKFLGELVLPSDMSEIADDFDQR